MNKWKELIKNNEALHRFIEDNESQLKKIAVLSVLVIVAFGVFLFNNQNGGAEFIADSSTESSQESSYMNTENSESEADGTNGTQSIYVDVGGAVKTPMLAKLPQGSRVEDAIEAAGGITSDADLTNINRAEFLNDGDKVYIPAFVSDEEGNIIADSAGSESGVTGSAGSENGSKVNINTADSDQLQTLNGVGPSTAQKIIDYRTSNGKFSSIEDIKNVSGIGDKTYEKLKDYITT